MINGSWGRFHNRALPVGDTSGTFKIVRSGGVITTHYLNGGEWVQLSTNGQGFPDRVRVDFAIDTSWDATSGVDHSAVFKEIVPNMAPAISGIPVSLTTEGTAYSFVPSTQNQDGDILTFTITNKPSWANFDTVTGAITGTPTSSDIGTTTGIVITVTDGQYTVSLPAFELIVQGTAILSGRVLTNVAGYTGLSVQNATVSLTGTGISTTSGVDGSFTFNNLGSGTYQIELNSAGLVVATQNVTIGKGENKALGDLHLVPNKYSQEQLNQAVTVATTAKDQVIASMFTKDQLDKAVAAERIKWDFNNDGKMGLEEVIYILQKMAGMR